VKERHVLSSTIKSREAYDAIADHVGRDDLSEQGWIIWEGITKYYETDPVCGRVDTAILSDDITRQLSADKHRSMFVSLIGTLDEFEASPANVVQDYIAHKRELVAQRLAAALLAHEDPERLLSEYDDLSSRTELGDDNEEEDRQGYSVMDLCASGFDPDSLVHIYPLNLNERLDGGVRGGHHLIVFARPEMGKTMLVIEMIAGFARQDLTCLYVGNEDPIDDVNMRIVNRMSGMTKLEVLNRPQVADEKIRTVGYDNVILHSASPGTSREITGLMEKYNPHVLVLDQLRNLDMKQDNYVLKLEEAATQARQWAKRYNSVVVSVVQAGESAAGKAVLTLGDVDYSKTGIPAQADLMIGMGATDQMARNGEVVLSLPKNKISGKHEYFTCLVDPLLSKVMAT
jgi:archaellum biogenesis ATPase FlaH